ncbi:MAG: GNAT family N-acetyltransferase [Gammaproteobacteria bacterium]|nr:GNAT family N-acetyltransferase [Gammaproteobacteria bacterium]MDE0249139.1 GNAT family N-acetyltransferase [Gammaproteobacteria bacterium]
MSDGVEPPAPRPLCQAEVAEQLEITCADLGAVETGEAVLELVDGYAREPMTGMGAPLGRAARERLIPALRDHPTTRVLLAWHHQMPVGLAISFVGFSTFEARPLLNLHDLFVRADYRGMGIGRALLSEVEILARRLGCCRVTLEVRKDNRRALGLYSSFGFSGSPDQEDRSTLFLTKML